MKFSALIFLAASQFPLLAFASASVHKHATSTAFDFSALTQSQMLPHTGADIKGCAHKPGAEISISGREFFYLQPGQIENLAVDLTGIAGQKIAVSISAESKGLALQGPHELSLDVNAEQLASFNVPVKALLDGRWVINLIVHSETAEGEVSARALALVVQVGNMVSVGGGQQKPTLTNADGAPMIVMPAQEEIL